MSCSVEEALRVLREAASERKLVRTQRAGGTASIYVPHWLRGKYVIRHVVIHKGRTIVVAEEVPDEVVERLLPGGGRQ